MAARVLLVTIVSFLLATVATWYGKLLWPNWAETQSAAPAGEPAADATTGPNATLAAAVADTVQRSRAKSGNKA